MYILIIFNFYREQEHWMLVIINLEKQIVYFLDSVNTDLRNEIGQTILM